MNYSFTVDSYLEIFTTIFGWHVYNVIWDALAGIILLPFLGIILSVWAKAFVDGGEDGSATRAVRDTEYQIYSGIFILFFVCIPFLEISRYNLSYVQQDSTLNQTQGKTVTGQNTGTTYDMAFGDSPIKTRVPIWWGAVISLSEGLVLSMKEGLNLEIKDVRSIQQMAKMLEIKDVNLRYETQRFIHECYMIARSESWENAPAIQDNDDWFGSPYFVNTPGKYDKIYAQSAVNGFKLDPIRDADVYTAPPERRPDFGRPSCKEWYEDTNTGLRKKIFDHISSIPENKEILDKLMNSSFLSKLLGTNNYDEIADKIIKNLASPNLTAGNTYRTDSIPTALRDGAAGVGLIIGNGVYEVFMANVIAALPIIQPMILMGIYMFLGLYMVLASFRPSAIVQGSLLIFTVKFWGVIWLIAQWLVDNLTIAMYPNLTFLDRFTQTDGKNMVLNLATLAMYMLLPILWSRIMILAGMKAGNVLDAQLLVEARARDEISNIGKDIAKSKIKP